MRTRKSISDREALLGVRFRVVGRVQGVGFRYWTRRLARELAIVGSVRNRSDGSVEIEAAGPGPSLARLREELRRGPPAAVVDRVEEAPCEVMAEEFEISD